MGNKYNGQLCQDTAIAGPPGAIAARRCFLEPESRNSNGLDLISFGLARTRAAFRAKALATQRCSKRLGRGWSCGDFLRKGFIREAVVRL